MTQTATWTIVLLAVWLCAEAAVAETPPAALQAVTVARTTTIPACTDFVDAAGGGAGAAQSPHRTIAAAVAVAKPGAIICVTEGTYAEELKPGEKPFTLAGGFKRGAGFRLRDSAAYISKAQGNGSGSFLRIEDPGPKDDALTTIDGFEISGYAQAIVRTHWESQRFEITNNFIHDNVCKDQSLAGAGFALNNISATIKGNVIRRNSCGRGGAGFVNNDVKEENPVSIESNLIDANAGTEPDAAHGGALYLFGSKLTIAGNLFTDNSVTHWGGGLYVGAFNEGGQFSNATLAWNIYRGNRAGTTGGGFFCDEGANCVSDHETYERNCGANIYLDSGTGGPTIAKFDHLTNVDALDVTCKAPGAGVRIDAGNNKADAYTFTNATFRGNMKGGDFVTGCDEGCTAVKASARIDHSMVQKEYVNGGVPVIFGEGIVAPSDAMPASVASDAKPAEAQPAVTPVAAAEAAKPAPDTKITEAAAEDPSVKDAFEAAKELGTIDAWNAFLSSYPTGFRADLARAYLKKLQAGTAPPSATVPPPAAATQPAAAPPLASPPATQAEPPQQQAVAPQTGLSPTDPAKPAIARAAAYMGFPERFNRYYTDPTWAPAKTIYVSPTGGGDGAARETPTSVADALAAAAPGTGIFFLRGAYPGGIELDKGKSGTYEAPIVLYAERTPENNVGVTLDCNTGTRQTCINLEGADYVAVDGFELVGGRYGVRAVGSGYPASEHARGIAVLDSRGHDQDRDPFFSGQVDWAVWERNTASGAGAGDGHGIYLSNGGDWNIVRFNETFDNVSSDFQINADPNSTCKEVGVSFTDPKCDAYAGTGEGGQGASDYFLVDGNYFHHGKGPGANFTSVRRSVIRNNMFGPEARHGVSFWQETDNPKLGASDNQIVHNLFVTTGRQALQFTTNSTRNLVANNVLLGVQMTAEGAAANPGAVLMEVDASAGDNLYRANVYIAGKLEGRTPNAEEGMVTEFSPGWFAAFPTATNHDPNDLAPTASAPFLQKGPFLSIAPTDRNGAPRGNQVDLGPIEVP